MVEIILHKKEILPIKFENLAKGENKILWGYFGTCHEYVIILSMIKEFLVSYCPEIKVTIACNCESLDWINEETIDEYGFRNSGENWLDKQEFKTVLQKPHPIEEFLSWLPLTIPQKRPKLGKHGLIVTHSLTTGRKLSPEQLKQAERFIKKYGLIPTQENNQEYEAVCGLEGPEIWQALRQGKPICVPEYCPGANLIKKLGGNILC